MNTVSARAKKEFIRFFLTHYQLKNREGIWILNYLVSVENLLEKVHFVDDIGVCPTSIVMSTFCSDEESFLYFKGKRLSASGEVAFQDIRQHKFQDLFIQLNFQGKEFSEKYKAIREEVNMNSLKEKFEKEDIELVNNLIEHSSLTFKKQWLLNKIDEALDRKDQDTFLNLTDQLNSMLK